jgi:type IV pilus assembly protein PilX
MRFLDFHSHSSLQGLSTPLTKQRGVSLPIVLIFLLLAIISVLGAFRAGFLNEKMVGNESDYNRAFAAAEAMIRDAEMDIRGRRPPYDVTQSDGSIGFPCRPTTDGSTTETTSKAGYEDSCRLLNSTTTPWFPRTDDMEEFGDIRDIVVASGDPNRCLAGICFPMNMTDLATIETQLVSGNNIGVPYGFYTRTDTLINANLDPTQSNPILATKDAGGAALAPRAWYVIEAFPELKPAVCSPACPAALLNPSTKRPYVYRITAVATGLRTGTRVVLKSIFVPYPKN